MSHPSANYIQIGPADPRSPDDILADGQRHHAAGRLGEAEAAYRRALELAPTHPNALHLLGVIALQVGKPAVAVELIGQAVAHAPRSPAFFSNLAIALRRVGGLVQQFRGGH